MQTMGATDTNKTRDFSPAACDQLADQLKSAREDILSAKQPVSGLELMRRHSDALDEVLSQVYTIALESAVKSDDARVKVRSSLALVATGGYGRKELAPFSDVDVSFISATDDDPDVDRMVKEAFHLLMDVIPNRSGLKIGYAYRTMDDYQALDHVTQTSLLDSRTIAGNPELVGTFTSDLRAVLGARFALTHAKNRFGRAGAMPSSLYAVEPDVKNGPGGLRDIQTVAWIAQSLFDCKSDDVWSEMVERRVLSAAQHREQRECRDFISKVRNALHLSANRQLDVATVERQCQIAEMLGLASQDELMRNYYITSEKVRRLCGTIARAMVSRRLPLDKSFFLVNGALALTDKPSALERPGVLVRAFRYAQEHDVELSAQLEEQILSVANSSPIDDQRSCDEFRSILDGENVYEALAQMSGLEVLQRLIPEFGALLHTVPADRVHEFTVGEHSLLVLKRLEEMRSEQETLCSGVWASVKDRPALLFAALMHDIGKISAAAEGHAGAGGEIVENIARRLGFSQQSVSTIKSLVANHELMPNTARRCDINSPATISEFAAAVRNVQMLRKLLLLSLADASSVGQLSYADMQRRFLEELYFAAEASLVGQQSDDDADRAERHRKRLERTLTLANLPQEMVSEHCDVMSPAYLLNTPSEKIAAHIEAVAAVREGTPVVRLDEDLDDRITELTVCAPDTGPGLLSQLAGVLFALDVTVHSAAVFTRSSTENIAIDTLTIDYLQGRLPYFKRKEVEREILRVLTHETTVEELLQSRGKSELASPVKSVQLLGRHSDTHSVVEIRADDADGLLYHMTRTIAHLKWNILSARVTTLGHTAIDTFVVAHPSRGRLPSSAATILKQGLNRSN